MIPLSMNSPEVKVKRIGGSAYGLRRDGDSWPLAALYGSQEEAEEAKHQYVLTFPAIGVEIVKISWNTLKQNRSMRGAD